MRLFWLTAAAAYSLTGPASSMSPTVADVMQMKEAVQRGSFEGRAAWQALGFYLQGAIEAMGGIQQSLEARGDHGLFCPPKERSFSMEDVFGSLDAAARRGDTGPALNAIFEDFQRQYPCP